MNSHEAVWESYVDGKIDKKHLSKTEKLKKIFLEEITLKREVETKKS